MTNNANGQFRWIFAWIGVLTLCGPAIGQKRPPNYSQDDMPITSFSCRDKIVGGYYADPETDCQMFHVCVHVPGVGIQNFRFLCPNDTSFDQEHQICDDWYNIDCELSSLYYSDNFDLYRIGVNNEVKKPPTSNKGTPIPLGPSSTIKPWQADKPKKYEDEDDYKRSGNDILRGSHSSNIYASSNRGRDDLDDNDYDAVSNVGANRQKLAPTNTIEAKKQKTFVRKLASKRPVTQRPVQQYYQQQQQPQQQQQQQYSTDVSRSFTTTVATPQYVHQSSPNYDNQFAAYSKKTSSPQSRGNVNFNSYASKIPKTEYPPQQKQQNAAAVTSPTIYQRINNLTEIELINSQEAAAAVTSTYEPSKTYENTYNFRQQTQAFNRQKIPAPKATNPGSPPTQATLQTDTVRLPSTDYLRTIAQTYQQPAAFINDQLQNTAGGRSNYNQQPQPQFYNNQQYNNNNQQYNNNNQQYNNQQQYKIATTKAPAFSTYDAEYQRYVNGAGYQSAPAGTVRTAQPSSAAPAFPTKKTTAYSTNAFSTYNGYSTTPIAGAASYWQPNATSFDYNKYYQTSPTSTPNPYFTSSPTTAFDYYRQPSSPAAAVNYDPYATFQKANNDKYDDEEFLKTAHSSNLKPSDINTIYNQKKQLYINATLKAAYSVDQPAGKSSYNRQSTSAAKSTTILPSINNANSNYVVASSSPRNVPQTAAVRAQSATSQQPAFGKTVPFGSLTQTASSSTGNNTTGGKNSDYDYAYYDNSNNGSAEYDQLDAVEQDFVKIQKAHNTKSKA